MPTLRLAVKPIRTLSASPAGSTHSGRRRICRMRPGVTDFRRLPATRRNSARRFSRAISATAPRRPPPSGGEPLAAPTPTTGQHFAAPDRLHAGAEAMAALADEFARLISALHGSGAPAILLKGSSALYTG